MKVGWRIAVLLILWVALPCESRGEEAQLVVAPGFIVYNMANQVDFGLGLPPSMVGATVVSADNPIPACEMLDDTGSIVGAGVILGAAIFASATPYGLGLDLDPASGHLDYVYYTDDSAQPFSIDERSDSYGITAITYRGMPSGPRIGQRYTYRPLLWEQVGPLGQWRLARSPDDAISLTTVGPPYAAGVDLGGSDGTLATFRFWQPIGADEAIVQVARDPYLDFPPDQIYEEAISDNWIGIEARTTDSVAVQLSQVPGSTTIFFWRVGARCSEDASLPRPYPYAGGTDYGWVWSGTNAFAYELGRFFIDVPTLNWAFDEIEACAEASIVTGYEGGTYRPLDPVTRDQMAVYISRALAGGDSNVPAFTGSPTFPDVGETFWALKYVEYAVDQAVVTGYEDGNYHPNYEVNRAQMAVYVARAMVAPTGEAALADYVPSDPRNFPDVASGFWAYKHIEYCVENGVVAGYEDGNYHPEIVVTRDQMAVYVARAFGL